MKLQVVMLDTHRTYMSVVFENEHRPYGKRLVSIELTPEQMEQLKPRSVGSRDGAEVFEEIGDVWLEVNALADRCEVPNGPCEGCRQGGACDGADEP